MGRPRLTAPRHICYVSGTRADFGLMRATLQRVQDDPALRLSVLATGMHLSPAHGETVREIEEAGFEVAARVPVPLEPSTGATMARNIGAMLGAFTDWMERARPDLVLLLGDRGEMLAGALAAIHLNIPIGHVHGGERSGTVDEPVRHAISKLAHLHLVATEDAAARLVRMGECEDNVFVTGAPGLDGIGELALPDKAAVAESHNLDPDRPFALLVFHPVLQEAERAETETATLLEVLDAAGLQILALRPNSDAGSEGVLRALDAADGRSGLAIRTHLARPDFLAAMARADLMAGNSSAGIIEAASFGTPVVNVGRRQQLRERNLNVRDVEAEPEALAAAIADQLSVGRYRIANAYGDGHAGERIARLLRHAPLPPELLDKLNGY